MNFDPTLTENFVISLKAGDIPMALEWATRAIVRCHVMAQMSKEPDRPYNDNELASVLTEMLESLPASQCDVAWQITIPSILGLLKQFVEKHLEAIDGTISSESGQESS